MRRLIPLLLLLRIPQQADARLMRAFTFAELRNDADLIAIAMPIAVKETAERAPLLNIRRTDRGGKEAPVMGAGVETEFEILTVLKG